MNPRASATAWLPLTLLLSAHLAFGDESSDSSAVSPLSPFRCGTCEYMQEQYARIAAGKQPVVDRRIVPPDFWSKTLRRSKAEPRGVGGAVRPMEAPYYWPAYYFGVIDDNRTDSDGDGLRECRYKIDLSALQEHAGYSDERILALEDECRRVPALWNAALSYVGLEFLEVQHDDFHYLIDARESPTEGTFVGAWSGMFNAFYSSLGDWTSGGVSFNYEVTQFGVSTDLWGDGAPAAVAHRPPGNPYVYLFPWDVFLSTDSRGVSTHLRPIGELLLHEMGHSLGLHHTWVGLSRSQEQREHTYGIDWLAWPTVLAFPPRLPSFQYAGEDFSSSNWSRGYLNTFMTYDRPLNALYPEIPAPIKAYIAHCYGRHDYENAQNLLDRAIQEQNDDSWLAQGRCIQEVEPNDGMQQSMSIQIGLPVLGALSSVNSASTTTFGTFEGKEKPSFEESYEDFEDWYQFEIGSQETGRALNCAIDIGSMIGGAVQIEIVDSGGQLLASSDTERSPNLQYVPQSPGVYRVAVKRSREHPMARDYLLSVSFSDSLPPSLPTWTPTPRPTPLPTPTPAFLPMTVGAAGETVVYLGVKAHSAAYAPDGGFVLSGSRENDVARLWALPTGGIQREFRGDNVSVSGQRTAGYLYAVAISSDGRHVLTENFPNEAILWDRHSGQAVRVFSGHGDQIIDAAFSLDGQTIATGGASGDPAIRLWDAQTARQLRVFVGHTQWISAVAFSPDGETLLSGSGDGTAKLWNRETGALLHTLDVDQHGVYAAAFSSDGQSVVTGGGERLLKMWDAASGSLLRVFSRLDLGIASLALSADGRFVLAGTGDGKVSLCSTSTGVRVHTFEGHTAVVNSVAFSPDGFHVLSASDDRTVRIWNAGEILGTAITPTPTERPAATPTPVATKTPLPSQTPVAVLQWWSHE